MGIITENTYTIMYFDVDEKKRVKTVRLMNLLDDVAVYQSDELGMSIETLRERKCTWMLLQWNVSINKSPSYREKLTVFTEPCGFRKCYGYRRYGIRRDSGELLLTAESIWVLFDLENKRPKTIPDIMVKVYGVTDITVFEIKKINRPPVEDKGLDLRVYYSDIDTNGHVNNVRYIEWGINCVPVDILKGCKLVNLRTNYRKEARLGDIVNCKTHILTDGNKKVITQEITDRVETIFLMESVWDG